MEFDIRTIFYKMCRICLALCENGVSICSSNVIQMISTCASVQIWTNDELPNQLCDKCILQLQNSFNFKQLIETSDMQLRKSLNIGNQNSTETQTPVYIKVEQDSSFNQHTRISEIKSENLLNENNKQNVTEVAANLKVKTEEIRNSNDIILPDSISKNLLGKTNSKKTKINKRVIRKAIDQNENSKLSARVYCEICKKLITKQYFKTHVKAHSKQFNCIYCNKVLGNQSFLDSHLVEFHNAEYILSKTLAENKNQTTDHLNQPRLYNLEQSNTSENSAEDFPKLNKAPDELLKNNNDTVGEIPDDREPCEVCGKLIVKRKRARHMQIHSDKRRVFQCSECEKSFFSKQYMKFHFETVHEKIYRFECTFCDKKFHKKIYCDRHEAAHRNEKTFRCSYCQKRFNFKTDLGTHIKAVHLKIYKKKTILRKPCKICGKVVSEKYIDRHLKIHKTGRETFECPLCPNKRFLSKISLESHTKIQHENAGPEHLCTICGKQMHTLGALRTHMSTHTEKKTFECRTCAAKFKGYTGLQYHMKSAHLKMRSYSCSVCSQGFFENTSLKRHMLIHTGERPFVCSICQRSFRQKSALRTHMKLIHSQQKLRRSKECDNSIADNGDMS